jgi:hypothetical protein
VLSTTDYSGLVHRSMFSGAEKDTHRESAEGGGVYSTFAFIVFSIAMCSSIAQLTAFERVRCTVILLLDILKQVCSARL